MLRLVLLQFWKALCSTAECNKMTTAAVNILQHSVLGGTVSETVDTVALSLGKPILISEQFHFALQLSMAPSLIFIFGCCPPHTHTHTENGCIGAKTH